MTDQEFKDLAEQFLKAPRPALSRLIDETPDEEFIQATSTFLKHLVEVIEENNTPTLYINTENYTESPRKEMDNLGHIVSWEDDCPGDERPQCDQDTWLEAFADQIMGEPMFYRKNQLMETIEKQFLFIPFYADNDCNIYNYSGNGHCKISGWIYADRDTLEEKDIAVYKADKILHGELQTYGQYCRGEVLQYTVEAPDGESLDSMIGIYPCKTDEETLEHIKETLPEEHKHLINTVVWMNR